MEKREQIYRGRFVGSVFADKEYHKKNPHYLHSHKNFLELFYVLEGSGFYYVNKHKYIVTKGNLVICNAGTTHGENFLKNNQIVSCCCIIDGVREEGFPDNTIIGEDQNPVLYFEGDEVGHIMQAIYGMYIKSENCSEDVCNSLTDALLELVFAKLSERETITEWNKRKQGDFINEIIDYLDNNYAEPITVESISEKFHISRSTLTRFFKKETGMTPLKYLLCRRIGEAQSYLVDKSLSVNEVGSLVGYYDSSHFSSVFRKFTGLTPSQYRSIFVKDIN